MKVIIFILLLTMGGFLYKYQHQLNNFMTISRQYNYILEEKKKLEKKFDEINKLNTSFKNRIHRLEGEINRLKNKLGL